MNIELNICLIPSSTLSTSLVEISQRFAAPPNHAIVTLQHTYDSIGPIRCAIAPHLTLYQVSLPLHDITKACNLLSEISLKFHEPITLTATQLSLNAEECSLEIRYAEPSILSSLQSNIIQAINPIRGNILLTRDPANHDLSASTDPLILTTGFHQSFHAFQPHVTLNWFDSHSEIDIVSTMTLDIMTRATGTFDELGMFVLGPYGTCPQLLMKWKLGGGIGALGALGVVDGDDEVKRRD